MMVKQLEKMNALILWFVVCSLCLAEDDFQLQCTPQLGCSFAHCDSVNANRHHIVCEPDSTVLYGYDPSNKVKSEVDYMDFSCAPMEGCDFSRCPGRPLGAPGSNTSHADIPEYFIQCIPDASSLPSGSRANQLRCKPRPGCDFTHCFPILKPPLDQGMFDPEFYKATYRIRCRTKFDLETAAKGKHSKSMQDGCDLKRKLSELTKNFSFVTTLSSKNEKEIRYLEVKTFQKIEDLSNWTKMKFENVSKNIMKKTEKTLNLFLKNNYAKKEAEKMKNARTSLQSEFVEDGTQNSERRRNSGPETNAEIELLKSWMESQFSQLSGRIDDVEDEIQQLRKSARLREVDMNNKDGVDEDFNDAGSDKFFYNGKYFWLITTILDHRASKFLCKLDNGVLANIYDAEHFKLIVEFIRSSFPPGKNRLAFWTGMKYDNMKTELKFSNGSTADYAKWADMEPSNLYSYHNRVGVEILKNEHTEVSGMFDDDPGTHHGALCEAQ